MKISKLFLIMAICLLIITGLVVVSCSDDDNPAASTELPGTWAPVGTGIGVSTGGQVLALTTYDSKLILGGDFSSIDGVTASNIAAWNGTSWTALGAGVTGGPVMALTTFVGWLVTGGGFDHAGGSSANHIAMWDGSSWGALLSGRAQEVYALDEFMNALFAGGDNGTGGGLALFSGSGSWTEMVTDITVSAFTIYDDDLIIGGTFNDYGSASYDNIFGFTGSNGISLGAGINGSVYALTVYNGKLIAGGDFTSAGGVSVNNIAAWDGATWAPLGEGTAGPVLGLTVFDGKLFAGGDFTHAGGIEANHIAAWDGSSWKALGSGTNNIVMAVNSYDNMLIAGGQFTTAGGVSASGIAAWDPE